MSCITKTRIGLILPSVNVYMEPEINKIAPDCFSFHATRVLLTETTPEALIKMEEDLDHACRLIASVFPKAVAYACTSGSFIKGLDWDQQIMAKIERMVGCPAVTTSSAMLRALKEVGITSVAVATPYIDRINKEEKRFLEENGFKVPAIHGLQITDAEILHAQTPQTIYEMVMGMDSSEVDGFFISCTDFRGLEVADRIEKESNKPVITSNQATLWALLKLVGYHGSIKGYGRLLEEL
jgi:maleate cis-trans isomerase